MNASTTTQSTTVAIILIPIVAIRTASTDHKSHHIHLTPEGLAMAL
jgi:hypothetical protein